MPLLLRLLTMLLLGQSFWRVSLRGLRHSRLGACGFSIFLVSFLKLLPELYVADMLCPAPILLIAWRRPSSTKLVLDQIRKAAPKHLYIACDGPSVERPGEKDKVLAVRELIRASIDWPCEIKTLYSDFNQGCRVGVSSAISWFFKHEEEGIILEDDCVPHPDFFAYCDELLDRYRNDTRIWWISGTNARLDSIRSDESYLVSRYGLCWGWATWRTRWAHYDRDLLSLSSFLKSHGFDSLFSDRRQAHFWKKQLIRLRDSQHLDTWDYQWSYTCLINGGLSVVPSSNLVSNIGFDQDATHTKNSYGALCTQATQSIMPLRHPEFLLPDPLVDLETFNTICSVPFFRRVILKLQRMLLLTPLQMLRRRVLRRRMLRRRVLRRRVLH